MTSIARTVALIIPLCVCVACESLAQVKSPPAVHDRDIKNTPIYERLARVSLHRPAIQTNWPSPRSRPAHKILRLG